VTGHTEDRQSRSGVVPYRDRLVALVVVNVVQGEMLAAIAYVAVHDAAFAVFIAALWPFLALVAWLVVRRHPIILDATDVEDITATLMALAVFLLVFSASLKVSPSLAFMQLCAQVVPVVLLALALQERVFGVQSVRHGGVGMMRGLLLVLLIGGEGIALATVYSGAVRMPFAGLAPAALGAALVALGDVAAWTRGSSTAN
jgi:hypothetical protein